MVVSPVLSLTGAVRPGQGISAFFQGPCSLARRMCHAGRGLFLMTLLANVWVPVDSTGGRTANNPLFAVDASSAANAWAVGNTSNGGLSQTLALHWNGTKWARVASPSPANPGSAD